MLVRRLLDHLVRVGTLTVIDADGGRHMFRGEDGPSLTVRLGDRRLHWRLFVNPPLALGEGYMDGTVTIEDGSIYDFLAFICANIERTGLHPFNRLAERLARLFRRVAQFNPIPRARRHAAHHYDLSRRLYELFLDRDRQYSCAYFTQPGQTLEQAQENKKRLIARKLVIEPGMRVLDIGSGWGGLALHLARAHGAVVTGITLSREQLEVAEAHAREVGLADRVQFHLRDYREQTGTFDRIVSVGMFEHVGINHYRRFFGKMRDLLTGDGIALLHTIGRFDGPGVTDAWIRKYIFPGGYVPALSEVTAAVERSDLKLTDIEVWRLHYAETLRHWRERFLARRGEALALYDERFCRMWEYYLAASEASFRHLDTCVFQVQMARRQDAVPLTRDYLAAPDRQRAAKDGSLVAA